ncbi:MAG: tetratricopeptide repeat protein, partial [Dehalococcoidia bacterium]
MRSAGQDSNGDALQHERGLIARARELAAQARTKAAAARSSQSDPLKLLRDLVLGYELEREICRGGQGVVYQGLQSSTGRPVAIKVMKEGPFAGPDDKARFDREVRILGQLNHPSIVTIYDSGTASGCFYFVMNYIEGLPLDAHMRAGTRTLEQTLQLFVRICEAVNAAHLRGIIHRDLKPSNILIDPDGAPHILDFGLAKVGEGSATPGAASIPAITLTGHFVGSLPWASPEQATGSAGGIDVRSDVYSLGVVLYQVLTGTFPYEVRGNAIDVVHRILHAEPNRPSAMTARGAGSTGPFRLRPPHDERWVFDEQPGGVPRERVNSEVEIIVLKCLSKEPERRYQNAGELARDIRHYLAGNPIEARRDSLGYVLRKHVQRHRLQFGFAASLLLVLVVGLVVSVILWQQAAAARNGLEDALGLAEQRERDVRQVVDAQVKMLFGFNRESVGARLREHVLAEARVTQSSAGEDVSAHLESLLAGINFTNVAVRTIERDILATSLEAAESELTGQPLVQAAIWNAVTCGYIRLGQFDAAMPTAERALEARRRLLGDDHADTIESISTMGDLLAHQGKPVEAITYTRDALERSRRVRGDEHPQTLSLIDQMGKRLYALGEYAQAEPYVREAFEKRSRLLGDEHGATLESMAGMGALLLAQGKSSEAEPYYRAALEGRRRGGDSTPATLTSVGNMAWLLRAQGRLADAEPYQREAMEGIRLVFGGDHP